MRKKKTVGIWTKIWLNIWHLPNPNQNMLKRGEKNQMKGEF